MHKSVLYPALRVAGIYTFAGIVWIIATDKLLAASTPHGPWIIEVSMYKGWFFVLASGLLIYLLLASELRERFKVESALRSSEGKLSAALDMAHLGHWEYDFTRDEFTFNDQFYGIFRTSVKDVGSYVMSSTDYARRFVHPDDLPVVADEIRKAVVSHDPNFTSRLEHRMLYADGEVGYITVQYFAVKDRHGRTLKTLGVNQDITERKKTENAVRESAQRYRSLFENMIEGFAWCKMIFEDGQPQDFIYLDVNESFTRLTGLRDVVGKRVTDVIPGIRESDPELFEIYARVSLTGKAEKFETYVDALGIWFSLSVYSTEPEHFIAVFDNITSRKRAEDALRQSEERNRLLASVVEGSSQPFASGWRDGRLDLFNKAFCDLTGYSEEETASINWAKDLTPPEYLEMESRKLAELLRTHQPVRYEKEYVRKDGSRVPVELLTQIVTDRTGEPLYLYAFLTDLTDRRAAEEALRKSEEELRLTLEATSDGIWKWDFKSDEMTVSDTWYTMLGYQPGEFIATYESWLSLMHPDDVQETRAATEAFASSRSDVYEREFRLRTKDNRYRWIHSRARVVQRDENGAPQRLIGNHQDITERKQSEEEVKRERDKLKGILDVFNDGVYIVNPQFEIEYVNPVMEATFGPVEGRKCFEYLHCSTEPCPLCHNAEVIAGHSIQREFHTEKVQKTFDIFETPMRREDGSFSNLVFFHDITERKKAEEARIQLATAIEQVGETVIVTDTEGKIVYVNPAFERSTGYTREEAMGNNPRMLKSGRHDDGFYQHLWKTVAGGRIWKGHLITKKKDGGLLEEEATISPIKEDSGAIVNYVAVKRDVTREVSLQQQLQQAQKMEAVGTLAGGVAHDFNNLLQVTLGYAELLLNEKKESDPEYGDLQKIFLAAKSGAELVRSLLTFSRKVEPKFIPLNLNRQILRVEALLKRTIPKMVQIEMRLETDLKEIYADPTQVEQVLMNLAVNAKDAMPDGGRLTVETRNVSKDEMECLPRMESQSEACVLLMISDTGHGMDEQTLEHVFEPFFTTKELGRGTGLGLAVVYGIVQQHGGHIRCESSQEHGTTFFLYFPAVDLPEETQPEAVAIPASGSETVLLVDDEDAVRDLGSRILARAGYTVLTAENGKEALEVFSKEKERISLVILDLIMPRMGGKDCLKELVQIHPGIKVLIASGFLADSAPRQYIGLGARGFVTKPFRLRELLERVRRTLDEA